MITNIIHSFLILPYNGTTAEVKMRVCNTDRARK